MGNVDALWEMKWGTVGEAEEGDQEWTPGFYRLTYQAGSGRRAAWAWRNPACGLPSVSLAPGRRLGPLVIQQGCFLFFVFSIYFY